MPFAEQDNLHRVGTDGQIDVITQQQREGAVVRDQTPADIFVCPSRRGVQLYPIGTYPYPGNNSIANIPEISRLDYAACVGDGFVQFSQPTNWNSAINSFQWPDALAVSTGISFQRSEISIADVSDGTSNTYAVGEKYLNPLSYFDGSDFTDTESIYSGNNDDTLRSTRLPPLQDQPGIGFTDRYGGPHPGVFIMAFCDGSTRGVSFSVDEEVHQFLGARNDGQNVNGNSL